MIETIEARFETLDERFGLKGDKRIERLHTGCRWTEGPAYFPAGRYLRLQRHPQRPDPALGRDHRGGGGVPAPRAASPTATPSTARAAWSAASTAPGG